MKPLRSAGLLLGLATLVLGCGGRSSSTVQVAFVSNNPFEFWSIAEAGARDAEKEFGVEVHFKKPTTGNAAEQKEIIDSLMSRGVKAVAISVIDPPNQADYLQRVAKRVTLLTVDNDAPDTGRLCYIGTDNYVAGKAAGELVKKAMPEGGTVAIFVGQIEALNARQRRQGVLDALAGKKDAGGGQFGKYKLHGLGAEHGPFTDNTDPRIAKENVDTVLAQLRNEPNVCLVGLWAYNPPAIYSAVKAKDLQGKVRIVGFDEDALTLQGVEKGDIYGTIVQQPYKFGFESVKLMAALAKGDRSGLPKDGMMPIPHRVITRENVQAFRAELKKLLGK